ncbi:MAG: synthase alpha/beta chain, terminal domain, partial [Chloroflexi bacterium]|nr:synthase alpha/beta chain, terminal domain [Chloroflexota bacterium]
FDDIPLEKVADAESAFHLFLEANYKPLLEDIAARGEITKETEAALKEAIQAFRQSSAF